MIVFELWSPHGSLQERLESACKVDETVAHKEEHTWVGDTNTKTQMYLYLITTEKEHTEEGGQRVHIPDQDGHLRQTRIRNTQNIQIRGHQQDTKVLRIGVWKLMTRFLGLEPVMLCYEIDIGKLHRLQQYGLEGKLKSYKNDFPLLNFLLKWILLCNLKHCFKM